MPIRPRRGFAPPAAGIGDLYPPPSIPAPSTPYQKPDPPAQPPPSPNPEPSPPVDHEQLIEDILARLKADSDRWKGKPGERGPEGPPGLRGPQGPPGSPGQDIDGSRLEAIEQGIAGLADGLGQLRGDLLAIDARYDSLAMRIGELEGRPLPPEAPEHRNHLVLVADQGASYWPRLKDQFESAKGFYSAMRLAEPPDFATVMPTAVLYSDGDPVRVWKGLRQVSDMLNRLTRGEYDPAADER